MSIETCKSSGIKSADAAIIARPAKLMGVTLIQAAAACSVVLYDNATAASGTELAKLTNTVDATTAYMSFNIPVEALNGIYADVTGTGATYIVHYASL